MSINKVILLGNVSTEPETFTFENGSKNTRFSIATNERPYKLKDGTEVEQETDFHNVEAKSPIADIIEKYVKKGDKIYIEGKQKSKTYEKAGEKRTYNYIRVTTVELLGNKKENDLPY